VATAFTMATLTSMAVGPDLSPTRLDPCVTVFFILENWSFVSVENNQYLKVAIFYILQLVSVA
jgi:hypothetical protein